MSAYVMFDVQNITDEETLNRYGNQVQPTIEPFDGVYCVVAGDAQALEGAWKPGFIVMIEFPSRKNAEDWYNSDAYTSLRKLRHASADSFGVIFSGVGEDTPPES